MCEVSLVVWCGVVWCVGEGGASAMVALSRLPLPHVRLRVCGA